jgi:hypothetical protein
MICRLRKAIKDQTGFGLLAGVAGVKETNR